MTKPDPPQDRRDADDSESKGRASPRMTRAGSDGSATLTVSFQEAIAFLKNIQPQKKSSGVLTEFQGRLLNMDVTSQAEIGDSTDGEHL